MMRVTLIAIFLLISILNAHAQILTQTIRGVVLDKSSNAPLPFANVVIMNSSPLVGGVTDLSGNFTLTNVPIGRHHLQASMVGYEPFIIKELEISSAKEVFLTIMLKETTSLSEVVVKPNISKEQPLNPMATVSAKMLSVEEAKRYAGGFDDPARLVSAFAGVSSNVGNNAIVVRGNSPQALQWKLEGVEIPNPNHFADMGAFGGGGLTALSSQLLSNSDFFSGAFPAEYNNALSGVFDIFMRKGNNHKREHTFQVGVIGIDASSEGPFKKGGNSSYLFNYRYATMSLLQPLLPENAGGVRYQDLSFKLNFPTRNAGSFAVWGIGLLDRSGAKAKKDSADWKYDSDHENQDVKQYMGATGVSHHLLLNNKQYLKSTIAATVNGIDLQTDRRDNNAIFQPKNKISNQQWNFVLSSALNTKLSAKHTNKTGFVATGLRYNVLLKNILPAAQNLATLVQQDGFSTLLAAYSNSTLELSSKTTMNAGINAQLFTLNNRYTIEPRVGVKHQLTENQALSFAYGLHSRLERINYYFARNAAISSEPLNKHLGFTRSHHGVVGYSRRLSEFAHLKLEAYYQHLFDVPVMADSSFALINQQNDWFFNGKLENTGKGKNYGVELTLEKYLSRGYYYLVAASVFDSRYKGGDGVWRDTRYNRNFAVNCLFGKEWQLGENQQKIVGLNVRVSYQGGERYSPVNQELSLSNQETFLDETRAFSKQFSPALTSHVTASYKVNKAKVVHEIMLKVINATMYAEFSGFQYNYQSRRIDERREAIFIPNLSYKIEF